MAKHFYSKNEFFEPGRLPLAIRKARHGNHAVLPHAHDFIELVFFVEGYSIHQYAGRKYQLTPGDLFIIHPGEKHSYVRGQKVLLFNCLFTAEALEPDLPYLKEMDGFFDLIMVEPFFRIETGLRREFHLNTADRHRVRELLEDMEKELEAKRPGYEAAARSQLIRLLVLVARLHSKARNESEAENDHDLEGPQDDLAGKRALIRDCIRYIEDHFDEQIRLDRLASRAFLSPEYFSRVFKKLTRKSPMEFIGKMRLDKAKELLKTTRFNMTEIAMRTGFHDSNYFSRQFKKSEGVTPGQFRKSMKAG